ncbi:MAG TPA: hypothetical protein VEK75_15085 [Xanthobacteraceae bacterium]|nr:hypothetical protein [Xanthobacteraceae bacterium]
MRASGRGGINVVAGAAAALTVALGGCSGLGAKKDVAVDANAYPANYRADMVAFLRQSLTDRAEFRGAMVSQPVLKSVGGSEPRYVACVQFNPRSKIDAKAAIFFQTRMSEFIDATPELCGGATYQPFNELAAAMP